MLSGRSQSTRCTAFRLCEPTVVSGMQRFKVGAVVLTRVEHFDVALDPSVVQLTVEQVRAVPWACPTWAEHDGNVRVGQAVYSTRWHRRSLYLTCGLPDDVLAITASWCLMAQHCNGSWDRFFGRGRS